MSAARHMDSPTPDSLRAKARKCRQLAAAAHQPQVCETLRRMAEEYEAEAARLQDAADEPPPPDHPPNPAA